MRGSKKPDFLLFLKGSSIKKESRMTREKLRGREETWENPHHTRSEDGSSKGGGPELVSEWLIIGELKNLPQNERAFYDSIERPQKKGGEVLAGRMALCGARRKPYIL